MGWGLGYKGLGWVWGGCGVGLGVSFQTEVTSGVVGEAGFHPPLLRGSEVCATVRLVTPWM